MAMKQEANSPVIVTIGAVSVVLLVVVIFGIEAWFRSEQQGEENEQFAESRNTWLDAIRDPQKARLESPAGTVDQVEAELAKHWPPAGLPTEATTTAPAIPVDKAYHVPLDLAMREIIKNNGQFPASPAPTTSPSEATHAPTGS